MVKAELVGYSAHLWVSVALQACTFKLVGAHKEFFLLFSTAANCGVFIF